MDNYFIYIITYDKIYENGANELKSSFFFHMVSYSLWFSVYLKGWKSPQVMGKKRTKKEIRKKRKKN